MKVENHKKFLFIVLCGSLTIFGAGAGFFSFNVNASDKLIDKSKLDAESESSVHFPIKNQEILIGNDMFLSGRSKPHATVMVMLFAKNDPSKYLFGSAVAVDDNGNFGISAGAASVAGDMYWDVRLPDRTEERDFTVVTRKTRAQVKCGEGFVTSIVTNWGFNDRDGKPRARWGMFLGKTPQWNGGGNKLYVADGDAITDDHAYKQILEAQAQKLFVRVSDVVSNASQCSEVKVEENPAYRFNAVQTSAEPIPQN